MAVDVETTGLDAETDRIVEVGWVRVREGQVVEARSELCAPGRPLPPVVGRLTGLTDAMLEHAPPVDRTAQGWCRAMAGAAFVVAYNAPFDRSFLSRATLARGRSFPLRPFFDPYVWARHLDGPDVPLGLSAVAARVGAAPRRAHRALDDAWTAAEVFLRLAPRLGALAPRLGALDPHLGADGIEAALRVQREMMRAHLAQAAAQSASSGEAARTPPP